MPYSQLEAEAVGIKVSGKWTEQVGESELTAGAGSDLSPTYTSATGQFTLRISGFGTDIAVQDAWRIDVRKVDSSWDAALNIFVKRTSNGTGTGLVIGGTSFQEVTNIDQTFFTGSNNRTSLDVQSRITGVSLQISPAAYTSAIVFTVVDI
jgi:hypothetical protein